MAQRKPRHTIGLILSNVSNDFSGQLIEEMERKFSKMGYRLLVAPTNRSVAKERMMLRQFAPITDGIIIISDASKYIELEDAIPTTIPIVFLNRKPSGCTHTCIIENDYAAVFQAVLSNCKSASDQIALLCNNRAFSTTKEITKAYKAAMASTPAGLKEDFIYYSEEYDLAPATLVPELVAKGCTTIFTATQTLTRAYLEYLMYYNKNHENHLSLIGFSNADVSHETHLSADMVTQPLDQLADLAVQQIIYLIKYPKTPARDYLIKGSLRKHVHDVLL